ncbi:MAG: hypothetical protein COT85_04940 [Chlamydiae bacterium CG10_big_fil_rev_8_21_14_0_10_42_34]|nr:MAG: hypothetical protein COT85_04940 [Chlamydiae bacterium CG10_big_fil_rev_8_21_14_0_10_42_34]
MISASKKWRWPFWAIFIFFLMCLYPLIQEKSLWFEIPIHFSKSGIPKMNVKIENQLLPVALDSGAANYLSLRSHEIEKIKGKTPKGSFSSVDFKGNHYTSPYFKVDRIQIEKIKLSEVPVIEENLSFILEGSILTPPISNELREEALMLCGRMGAKLFESVDFWLLDFPASRIVAIRDLDEYKKVFQISFSNYAVSPLEYCNSHIVVTINTDLGLKKFSIDTGSKISLLNPPSEYTKTTNPILISNEFSIGNKKLGPFNLRMYHLDPTFPFDGILGRDFLMKRHIFLDFKNKKAYVEASSI